MPLTKIADCHFRLEEWSMAEEKYRAAIAMDGECAEAYWGLSKVLGRQRKLDDALRAMDTAIRLKPNCAPWHYLIGEERAARSLPGAEASYRTAIRLQPNHIPAHIGLAALYHNRSELKKTIAVLERVLELGLPREGEYTTIDAAHRREGYDIKAEVDRALLGLGIMYRVQADLDRAVAVGRQAVKRKPTDAHRYGQLGLTLSLKDDWAKAAEIAKKGIELDPKCWLSHYTLCACLGRVGRYREALEHVQTSRRLTPKNERSTFGDLRRFERSFRAKARWAIQLEAIRRGETEPDDLSHRAVLADVALDKRYTVLAATWFHQAFEEKNRWNPGERSVMRESAIRAAALAGAGVGLDAENLSETTRATWRARAREWMHASLAAWEDPVEAGDRRAMKSARRFIRYWQQSVILATLRTPEALAKRTPAERKASRALWTAAEALLAKAAE